MPEKYESDNKVAGGPGITAGGDVSISDVSGQVAIGEHIHQSNLILNQFIIYNDYSSSQKERKIEELKAEIIFLIALLNEEKFRMVTSEGDAVIKVKECDFFIMQQIEIKRSECDTLNEQIKLL